MYITKRYLKQDKNSERKLPSIRQLALDLQCSRNSVIHAYMELEQQHKIYSIPQSGYYIMKEGISEVKVGEYIDLVSSNPDPRVLPYREFAHCMNRAVEEYKEELFLYPDPQGFPSLRNTLVSVFRNRQVHVDKEQICITNGVQQAIDILFGMKLDGKKDTIVLEIPGYPLAAEVANRNAWKIRYVRRDANGIALEQLETYFKEGNVGYFYLMPRFHNPTGWSLVDRQKKKIVELAAKYDVYIIEDDYLAELDIVQERLPIHYYDINERVIYLAGFSKSFMPGLRIGAVCMPKVMLKQFVSYKYPSDLGTATYLQGALDMFLINGMYERHCKKIRKIYCEKMQISKLYYEQYRDRMQIKLEVPESGYYLWISFGKSISKYQVTWLVDYLKKHRILVLNGARFYPDKDDMPAIRICISNCAVEQLKIALKMIFMTIIELESKVGKINESDGGSKGYI